MSAIDTWDGMGLAARVILVVLMTFAFLIPFIVAERFVAYRRAGRPGVAPPAPLQARLQGRMHVLAAIKVTAPMLGLLGTLLGLINGFAGVAMGGVFDAHALGAGMSEALTMSALGLVIGLPAWWAHAFYAAWAERILARAAGAAGAR